ncbi:BP74-related protein [Fodinibius salsisoli]|uniref:BP74 N-terminal domain-containing protein n=1 Tax=Fodinibius salsisoli TaxID=2820877 RepID=A0ABT3PM47_9BACT|nr:hypothetical protein [Fodinibius salsisoli]MCW9707017.1 hypothetical protein [Fodinibius salsisoli]
MIFTTHRLSVIMLALFIGFVTNCNNNSGPDNESPHYFEFTHQGEEINYTFVAKTSSPEVISKVEDELSKPMDQRNLHIHGTIARGSKEYNSRWSWHFVPGQWDLVEVSAEVCDGRPGMVEEDLDYWVDQVGTFCPWSSVVSAEAKVE